MKKLITIVVLSVLCITTAITPTNASASTTTVPGQTVSNAVLDASATRLDVTVPTSVLIYVDATGNVITPDNVSIINNTVAPVLVTSLAVTTEDDWILDNADTDYTKFKMGHKNFSMTLNGQDPSVGTLTFDAPIDGESNLLLTLSADVSPQKEAISAVKIAEMIITVDWYADDSAADHETTYPEGYVLAIDADFSGDVDGSFQYIGTAEYVVIPDTIKGIPVTSYADMFYGTAVKGVISTNPNITDMSRMFCLSTATTLDLSKEL